MNALHYQKEFQMKTKWHEANGRDCCSNTVPSVPRFLQLFLYPITKREIAVPRKLFKIFSRLCHRYTLNGPFVLVLTWSGTETRIISPPFFFVVFKLLFLSAWLLGRGFQREERGRIEKVTWRWRRFSFDLNPALSLLLDNTRLSFTPGRCFGKNRQLETFENVHRLSFTLDVLHVVDGLVIA